MQNRGLANNKTYFTRLIKVFIIFLICSFCCSCESLKTVKVSGSYQSSDIGFSNTSNTINIQYSINQGGTKIIFSSKLVHELYDVAKLKPQTVFNTVEIYFW